LPEKTLCDKLSPYKFSVAVGTVYYIFLYQVAIDWKIECLVLYFKLLNWKKCAELCKNFVRSQLAQYCWAPTSEFWGLSFHSRSSCCYQQEISHPTEIGLRLLPSMKTHMRYMWHVSYYSYHGCAVSVTTMSI